MGRKSLWFAFLVVTLVLVFCCGGCSDDSEGTTPLPVALVDGEWVLRVDRALDQRPEVVRMPTDTLTEADFRPLSEAPTYSVAISKGGAQASIQLGVSEDSLFEAHRLAASGDRVEYGFGELGGDGRFIVGMRRCTPGGAGHLRFWYAFPRVRARRVRGVFARIVEHASSRLNQAGASGRSLMLSATMDRWARLTRTVTR